MNEPSSSQSLFDLPDAAKFERFTALPKFDGVPALVLDVPESIPALGYGSHQFFRYYGKFPSLVGREIISAFSDADMGVLDNYSGSGTTQVEAQIAGRDSFGIDINPLAVLASNVKTAYQDARKLDVAFARVCRSAEAIAPYEIQATPSGRLRKWFSEESLQGLGRLRAAIDELEPGDEQDFLTVCFLAIVRRCSNAHDGEVRPHVKLEKKPRPPATVFREKYLDMVDGLRELDTMRPKSIKSKTVIGDNRTPKAYAELLTEPIGLVVSHPPYLNSFNYFNAFSLEIMWSEGMANVWQGWTLRDVTGLEQKAHPATNGRLVESYYQSISEASAQAFEVLRPGGTLALVVGDATIHGQLEAVHRNVWDSLKSSGWRPEAVWFRTTHYGIGKYAYAHRADYHGEAEKKDAIMFLRKP
jgi:hypothetical protein